MILRRTPASLLLLASVALAPATGQALDWPQWRGPDRTDLNEEKGLLESWPEGGPRRVWLFENAGVGYSGFAVVDGRLYTAGTRDNAETLIALDVENGKEIWSTPIGPILDNNWGDGPRSTPTVDGDHVYVLGGKGDLLCARRKDGKKVWAQSLTELGGKIPGWGYTESVLVDGPLVVATPGGKKGALAAFDKKTGEVRWRSSDFTDGAQYASIIVAQHNGSRQYIQLTMKSVVGIDAKNGDVLWRTDWPGATAVIPTPIFDDGRVYITSGYGVGCNLFKIGAKNAVESLYDDEARKVMKNHHGGVILYKGHVYGHSDGPGWVCQELASGKSVWNERRAIGKGAIGYADGKFFLVDERSGTVAMIRATPEAFDELGRFTLEPQSKIRKPSGRIWVHPTVVNGRLYLRDQDLVYCYDVKKS